MLDIVYTMTSSFGGIIYIDINLSTVHIRICDSNPLAVIHSCPASSSLLIPPPQTCLLLSIIYLIVSLSFVNPCSYWKQLHQVICSAYVQLFLALSLIHAVYLQYYLVQ